MSDQRNDWNSTEEEESKQEETEQEHQTEGSECYNDTVLVFNNVWLQDMVPVKA